MTTRVRALAACPSCGDVIEDTHGEHKCRCVELAEWERYADRGFVDICPPCELGDHRSCEGCDCAHADEPPVNNIERTHP